MKRPPYESLKNRPGYPDYSSWGLYGPEDEVGVMNEVTEEQIAAAAKLVTEGRVYSLNWDLLLPEPALYGRCGFKHTYTFDGYGVDDKYDGFWPQRSSQWDALSHIRHPHHGFYMGKTLEDVQGVDARNGIHNLGKRGIAGRFIFADIARWRAHVGRPLDASSGEGVHVGEIEACLAWEGVSVQPGDHLIVRFGWIAWYEGLSQPQRDALIQPETKWKAAGLESSREMVRWIWDSGLVSAISDTPSVEQNPFDPSKFSLHTDMLALLGIPLGEQWYLEELSQGCAKAKRYTGLLVSAPFNLRGGAGSSANAIALQ